MCPTTAEEIAEVKRVPYLRVVGRLMYLMLFTWPNLCHAIGILSRFGSRRTPHSNIREEFAEHHESEVNPLCVRYKDEPWTEDKKLSNSKTVAGCESGNNEVDCAAIQRRSASAAPRKAQTGGNRIQQKPAERFARVGETRDKARSHRQKVVLKVGDRERAGVYAPEEDVENAENNRLLAEMDAEGEQDALVDMTEAQDDCDGEELGPMGIPQVNVTSERRCNLSRWHCIL
jgi:hypothetical protein